MPSPYLGMDPCLEDPAIWSGVHAAILGAVFEMLGPAVGPKYAVRFEERVFVTGEDDPGYRSIVPDVRVVERDSDAWDRLPTTAGAIAEPIRVVVAAEEEIHEQSLHVVEVRDRSVVTVIELLSPANKTARSFGREGFLRKRREVLAGDANWLEIDLLREGIRTPNPANAPATPYRVYLSRSGPPRDSFVRPIRLEDRLPTVAVPLRGSDADVPLDLQLAVNAAVERGSYDLDTDYSTGPVPTLTGADGDWARRIIGDRSR